MSIAGNNVITRLNYCQREIGRKIKSSKKYHQWEFSLNGNYHKIELFHSLASGRKKLVVDGEYIFKDDSYLSDFKYEFEVDGKILELKQKKTNEYELFICDKSFSIMKKEEQEGKDSDLVEKKIEELKLCNEYNKRYINKRNQMFEEHDFEQEEEEEECEESENNDNYVKNNCKNDFSNNYNMNNNYNKNNNCRNDDDFYKSNDNDFDFSNTAFEKNKKILENFNFFGEENNSNNNNNYQNQNNNNNLNYINNNYNNNIRNNNNINFNFQNNYNIHNIQNNNYNFSQNNNFNQNNFNSQNRFYSNNNNNLLNNNNIYQQNYNRNNQNLFNNYNYN